MPMLTARLDPAVRSSLTAHLGERPQVLAWAKSSDGHAIGLPGQLAVQTGDDWVLQPWHEIGRGTWDAATGRLSWEDAAGTRHELTLHHAKRFCELFNERVTASIVFTGRVDLGDSRHAVISLRQDLGSRTNQTAWTVTPGPKVDLADPEIAERIASALQRAANDFGIS